MRDSRIDKLANILIDYSVSLQKDENILLEFSDVPSEMASALIEKVSKIGANVSVNITDKSVMRTLLKYGSEESFILESDRDVEYMKKMHSYIAIRGGNNSYEYSDVPSDRMSLYNKYRRIVINQRINHSKWCVLRWPTPAMAQSAGMSTSEFEDFYFDVCTMDYAKMAKAVIPLKELMERTNFVQITHDNGTNITFSIKDIPVIPCVGNMNIPDGECFTAPIKDSVNGKIVYNTPTVYDGKRFENIVLHVKNGRIEEATSSDTKGLNEILDRDEGARYFGEFAIGFNPYITKPMCDILFDEKIAGSFHLTPGKCYEDASNGNKSLIHWDMVQLQTNTDGVDNGGSIWFDGVLIRKNGLFVLDELKGLNPENLR